MYNILFESGIPRKLVMLIKMCLNEIYSTVRICKNVIVMFHVKNSRNKEMHYCHCLLILLYCMTLRRIQVKQDGLKLIGTHQLLFYVDDVNILDGSIHTVKENTEALVVASKKIGLEINSDKTKYIVMSRNQNARQSHSIKVDSSSFERVEDFKYLGTTLKNQNSIQEEIKIRLKLGMLAIIRCRIFCLLVCYPKI